MTYEAHRAGKPFKFNAANMKLVKKHIAKYPKGRQKSAVMPLLDLAQRQNGGWISQEAIETIADILGLPPIRVHEVASFYTMYNLQPVGKYLVQVCHTTPCWLRGADKIIEVCEEHLGVHAYKETTEDGKFTLMKAECLGACANAPMVQINDHFYEDIDADTIKKILDALKRGKQPKTGSQLGRKGSEPVLGRKMGKKVV